jgi:hypothetical protein
VRAMLEMSFEANIGDVYWTAHWTTNVVYTIYELRRCMGGGYESVGVRVWTRYLDLTWDTGTR